MSGKNYSYISKEMLINTCLQLVLICLMIYGFGQFVFPKARYTLLSKSQDWLEPLNSLRYNCSSNHDIPLNSLRYNCSSNHDIPFCQNKDHQKTVSIMLIGDSVDKLVVRDSCDALNGTYSDYVHGALFYIHGAGFMCSLNNGDSLATLHTFGSKPYGPYAYDIVTTAEHMYVNTGKRIQKGLSLFKQRTGKYPDYVSLNIAIWDMFSYVKLQGDDQNMTRQLWTFEKDVYMASYIENMQTYLQTIKETTGPQTKVFLHTKPQTGYFMHKDYMNGIRQVGARSGIPVIEWDQMTANSSDVLRDTSHPRDSYTSFFGKALLDFFHCL